MQSMHACVDAYAHIVSLVTQISHNLFRSSHLPVGGRSGYWLHRIELPLLDLSFSIKSHQYTVVTIFLRAQSITGWCSSLKTWHLISSQGNSKELFYFFSQGFNPKHIPEETSHIDKSPYHNQKFSDGITGSLFCIWDILNIIKPSK